jgi:hypothetical protein
MNKKIYEIKISYAPPWRFLQARPDVREGVEVSPKLDRTKSEAVEVSPNLDRKLVARPVSVWKT